MGNFFKEKLGIDIPVKKTVNKILGKEEEEKPLVFRVGENLSPEGKKIAYKKIEEYTTPQPPKENIFTKIVDNFKSLNREPQGMVFPIGEGLTPEQKREAEVVVRKPAGVPEQTNFFADILRAGPRAFTSVLTGNELQPSTPLERFVLGDESVKPVAQRVAENELKLKELGLDKSALPLSLAGTIGLTTLDIFPGLPGKKKLAAEVTETVGKLVEKKLATKEIVTEVEKKFGKEAAGEVSKAFERKAAQQLADEEAARVAFNADEYVAEQVAKREVARTGGGVPVETGRIRNFFNSVKSKLVDSNAPIEDALRKAEKDYQFQVRPQFDISNQIDRVYRTPNIAGQFVKDNGLENVIKNVDNLDALDQYLIARQALRVESKGIKTGRDLVKDRLLVEQLGPKYQVFADEVSDYSRKLLDYSVDSGLVSKELAEELKKAYPDYVPLNRVFSELEKVETPAGKKAVASLSKQTVVQTLKGSEREIESPVASLLSKTYDAFLQGEKNKAGRLLAGYKDLPGFADLVKELQAGQKAAHTFSFLDNGIKRTFATTPEIEAAAKALNVQSLNILGKILAAPVRVAKAGITGLNIPFILANVVKDQLLAFITSKNALRTSIANPEVFLKSLLTAVGHGELYDEMVRQAASGTSLDIAKNQIPKTIDKIRSTKSLSGRIKYAAKNPSELLRALENVVGRGEEFTRASQYIGTKQALLKQGRTELDATLEAAKAARENTANFYRRGEWGTVLNSAFLYLNAGIQGSRNLIRAFEQQPVRTSIKLALSAFTPVAIATAWNLSDPERKEAYEDIADYEKKNNIIIIPPHPIKDSEGKWNIIKIPLPQGINSVTNAVRRGLEGANGLDPVKFKEIAGSLIGAITPVDLDKGSILSSFTPQAIKPTIEATTNRNLFTGFPQVPESMERLSSEQQVKETTSGAARKIGGAFNLSPIKVEEFIRGTTGEFGTQIVNLTDRALAGLDIIPKDQIGGRSIIEGIVGRFTKARGGKVEQKETENLRVILQKQADERFRVSQEAELLYGELKQLPKEEANGKVKELKQNNPELYQKLVDVAEDNKRGLTYEDRLINQLGVENGEKAKFIYEVLKGLPTKEEKNAYVRELQGKGIISDTVMKQLRQLKEKGY